MNIAEGIAVFESEPEAFHSAAVLQTRLDPMFDPVRGSSLRQIFAGLAATCGVVSLVEGTAAGGSATSGAAAIKPNRAGRNSLIEASPLSQARRRIMDCPAPRQRTTSHTKTGRPFCKERPECA
ncbi:hypothetical protein [Glacieibacterium sp.]|uniref:hypothetical protein n=1 Tax=Glacieibacterium sp. TaxID=2860237 RepID=UPI003B001EFA